MVGSSRILLPLIISDLSLPPVTHIAFLCSSSAIALALNKNVLFIFICDALDLFGSEYHPIKLSFPISSPLPLDDVPKKVNWYLALKNLLASNINTTNKIGNGASLVISKIQKAIALSSYSVYTGSYSRSKFNFRKLIHQQYDS